MKVKTSLSVAEPRSRTPKRVFPKREEVQNDNILSIVLIKAFHL